MKEEKTNSIEIKFKNQEDFYFFSQLLNPIKDSYGYLTNSLNKCLDEVLDHFFIDQETRYFNREKFEQFIDSLNLLYEIELKRVSLVTFDDHLYKRKEKQN